MDYLEERKLNLRDMNLEHVKDETYRFQGIEIDMTGCGRTHLQMYRHIAEKLAEMVTELQMQDANEKMAAVYYCTHCLAINEQECICEDEFERCSPCPYQGTDVCEGTGCVHVFGENIFGE